MEGAARGRRGHGQAPPGLHPPSFCPSGGNVAVIWGCSPCPSSPPKPASFHVSDTALLCAALMNGAFLLGRGDSLQERRVFGSSFWLHVAPIAMPLVPLYKLGTDVMSGCRDHWVEPHFF